LIHLSHLMLRGSSSPPPRALKKKPHKATSTQAESGVRKCRASSPAQQLQRELLEEHARRKQEAAAAQAKAMEREVLRERLATLETALDAEKKEKEHLRRVTVSLRQRVDTMRSIAGELEIQQQKFDAFTAAGRATAALRNPERVCESSLASLGSQEEAANLLGPHGRTVKRTAYCTDYANIRYLGEREADAKESLQRKAEALLRTRGGEDREATASGSNALKVFPPLHQRSGPLTKVDEVRGLSMLGYVGGDSRVNLEQFHKRSTNRTRSYRDHEGKLIYMDTCDWPVTEGVAL